MTVFRQRLSQRIHKGDLDEMAVLAQGHEEMLWQLARDEDKRIAYNALWVMDHFGPQSNEWLQGKHDQLIDMVMAEKDSGKRRLLLSLLTRQPFPIESLRTDFVDYCLNTIIDTHEATGNRAHCVKLAYAQCRHYPELLGELEMVLTELKHQELSPGMMSIRKNTLIKINK